MKCIFLFLIVQLLQVRLIENQSVFAKQTTHLLDRLLLNYNKYSRPSSTEPTKVHINLQIKDIAHDRKEMMFTMQCILNQWWLDARLSYWKFFVEEKNRTFLPFDPLELANKLASIKVPNEFELWKTDTYFLNGKPTSSNSEQNKRLIRLHLDGTVLLSTRVMLKFKCKMDWTRFPHDVQRCPLHLASFSHTDKEISYRWISRAPCTLSSKFALSQLNLVKVSCVNKTRKLSPLWSNSKKYRSTISLDFYFKRNTGIYLIEVYLPCVVLVMTSFSSFYINREATNVRILVGSMTTLSMIILSIENRLLVKSVPYYTAIDYFVMVSFTFIFASILEFIFVHQHTKVAYGDIGTYSNWIPVDRIAKLIYSALQPKEQIARPPSTNPSSMSKDDRLAAAVRLSSEPMIYDLPITDVLKDEQTLLMNNLLLNNQASLGNQISLISPMANQVNMLSLRRPSAAEQLIDQTPNIYSTFPRANHHSLSYQADASVFNSSAQLNESLISDSGVLMNASNLYSTTRRLKRRLASIPEESAGGQPESTNQQMADSLKQLRQRQERQLDEQNELRNAVFERSPHSTSSSGHSNFDSPNGDNEVMSNRAGGQSDARESRAGLGYRLNEKINAKRLSSGGRIGRVYYELLGLLCCHCGAGRAGSQLENDSIDQLNSISEIDQVCRVLFPLLYLLFILSYYVLFVI